MRFIIVKCGCENLNWYRWGKPILNFYFILFFFTKTLFKVACRQWQAVPTIFSLRTTVHLSLSHTFAHSFLLPLLYLSWMMFNNDQTTCLLSSKPFHKETYRSYFLFVPAPYCGVQRSRFHFCLWLVGKLFFIISHFFNDNVSGILCYGGKVVSSVPPNQNVQHKQCWMTACCFCLLSACTSRPNLINSYLHYIYSIFNFIMWCTPCKFLCCG